MDQVVSRVPAVLLVAVVRKVNFIEIMKNLRGNCRSQLSIISLTTDKKKAKIKNRANLYEKILTEILFKPLLINFEIRCQSWRDLVPNSQELCYRAMTAALKAANVTGDGAEVGVILANNNFVQSSFSNSLNISFATSLVA